MADKRSDAVVTVKGVSATGHAGAVVSLVEAIRAAPAADLQRVGHMLSQRSDLELAALRSGDLDPSSFGDIGALSSKVVVHLASYELDQRGIRSDRWWRVAFMILATIFGAVVAAVVAYFGLG